MVNRHPACKMSTFVSSVSLIIVRHGSFPLELDKVDPVSVLILCPPDDVASQIDLVYQPVNLIKEKICVGFYTHQAYSLWSKGDVINRLVPRMKK